MEEEKELLNDDSNIKEVLNLVQEAKDHFI